MALVLIRLRRIVCAFVVCLQQKSGFLASRPMYTLVGVNHIVLNILQNGENQSWEEYYRSVLMDIWFFNPLCSNGLSQSD